jgi:hypothetical protein
MPDMTTGRSDNGLPALGICLEEYPYPHPVRFMPVQNDLRTALRTPELRQHRPVRFRL